MNFNPSVLKKIGNRKLSTDHFCTILRSAAGNNFIPRFHSKHSSTIYQ